MAAANKTNIKPKESEIPDSYFKVLLKCIPCFTSSIASRRKNFLALPILNTLKKCINYTTLKSGFNPDQM